jgi:hypothetical protein
MGVSPAMGLAREQDTNETPAHRDHIVAALKLIVLLARRIFAPRADPDLPNLGKK